jgi:diacylglycerol kinase family enzyme
MPAPAPIANVIMNRGSGADDKSALQQEIETAFRSHGWAAQFIMAGRIDLQSSVKKAVATASGALVVAGGDGTINAVASACGSANRPFGILPAGTFNYVVRNLGLPTDVPQAVSVIVGGHPRPVDAGEINGRIFLNNAGFGLYTDLIERRETDKRRFGRNRIVALFSGLKCMLGSCPLYDVDLTADGEEESLQTTTLFFGCNALQLENYNVAAVDCLRGGKLAVLSLKLRNRRDIAAAAFSALTGKLEEAQSIDAFCARIVRIRTRRRRLKVALDGEIVILNPPLEVTLRVGALQVFAPPQKAGERDV